mmetsp:Transcript_34709/g.53245  ORF Transcript_34709/g.53245 Transcript_34709/m.53245 type:complete len:83 (+) Transcript_34709:1211-1459(+)
MQEPTPPPQNDNLGGLLNDDFGNAFGDFGGAPQKQPSDYQPPSSDGFDLFNDVPKAPSTDQQFNHDRLMTGLQDLNFDMPAQ